MVILFWLNNWLVGSKLIGWRMDSLVYGLWMDDWIDGLVDWIASVIDAVLINWLTDWVIHWITWLIGWVSFNTWLVDFFMYSFPDLTLSVKLACFHAQTNDVPWWCRHKRHPLRLLRATGHTDPALQGHLQQQTWQRRPLFDTAFKRPLTKAALIKPRQRPSVLAVGVWFGH